MNNNNNIQVNVRILIKYNIKQLNKNDCNTFVSKTNGVMDLKKNYNLNEWKKYKTLLIDSDIELKNIFNKIPITILSDTDHNNNLLFTFE
jgi:hypothetical protein